MIEEWNFCSDGTFSNKQSKADDIDSSLYNFLKVIEFILKYAIYR